MNRGNPFESWPLEDVKWNLLKQIDEVRQSPMLGKNFGKDISVFSSAQRRQMFEVLLREEAIRWMEDRVRKSRSRILENIDLPTSSRAAYGREVLCVGEPD